MNKNDWKLWLDDQLDDPDCPNRFVPPGFVGAKSSEEAKNLVRKFGVPSFMDLDHDLGNEDSAMIFLHWLANCLVDKIPEYKIHSMNPAGVLNISSFMESWKKIWDK